jgi:hypothetical protein
MKRISLLIVALVSLYAQSTTNPNISIVGDLRIFNEKNNDGKDTDFGFHGMELVIENYLNPYSKAWTTIHVSDDEKIDIEEAYLTIVKGLPLNSQIRLGRYLLPFGEIMQKHAHAYGFFDYPGLHQAYFGEEGTRNLGFELNFAFPVFDQFTELKLNVLEGNLDPHSHDHGDEGHEEEVEEDEHDHEEESSPALAYGAYYSVFTELSDVSHLKTSVSYIYGANDQEYEQSVSLMAYALKYKYQPSDYTYFEVLGEYFLSDRHIEHHDEDEEELLKSLEEEDHHGEELSTNGYFLAMNYQFNKAYNLGFSYSNFDSPVEEYDVRMSDFAIYTGYAPFEESLLFRLKFARNITLESNRIELQAIFSLGPHKAHQF